MTVVYIATAIDRFVVPYRNIAADTWIAPYVLFLDGYRLDPVNRILQREVLAQFKEHLKRPPRICRFAADI